MGPMKTSYAAHHWHWPLIVIVRLTGASSSVCRNLAMLELHLEMELEYLGVELQRLSWNSNCYGLQLRCVLEDAFHTPRDRAFHRYALPAQRQYLLRTRKARNHVVY